MTRTKMQLRQIRSEILTLIFLLPLLLSINPESLSAQEVLKFGPLNQSNDKILVVTNRAITTVDESHFIAETYYDSDGAFSYFTAFNDSVDWGFKHELSISSMMNQDFEYDDWLVFVHGDSKSLLDAVKRAEEIRKLHHVNVMVYSWPSKDPEVGPIANYKNSFENVEKGTIYFRDFLKQLDDLKTNGKNLLSSENLSIFFHSLGNYFVKRLVLDSLQNGLDNSLFDNLILNAAAVEAKDHQFWVEQLNFSKRIYINSNDDDISLTGLRILTPFGMQLGEDPQQPYAINAIYVNFTEAVGFPGSMGPSHSYYFASITEKSKNIKEYYTSIFHGEEAQLKNEKLFAFVHDKKSYKIKF